MANTPFQPQPRLQSRLKIPWLCGADSDKVNETRKRLELALTAIAKTSRQPRSATLGDYSDEELAEFLIRIRHEADQLALTAHTLLMEMYQPQDG